MSEYTIPDFLENSYNNTPGVCLDRCRDRNYTYAGVLYSGCYCGHATPKYARVHPSQCSDGCPGDASETCGKRAYGINYFSVVGPGYPSIPAYCVHASSVPYFHYDSLSLGPKHCMKVCALGLSDSHLLAVYATGGYQYASRDEATCTCGTLPPPSYLEVEKSKCDNPCRWFGPEKTRGQWKTKDILSGSSEVEYFDPRLIGTSAEWAGDSSEEHEADSAKWVCGGKEYDVGSERTVWYKSVYKITHAAPLDDSEEDSGMEVSSVEDSSMED